METKASNNIQKWKYFSLGILLGFFIFFLYYDKVQQDMNFLAAKKAMIDLAPFKVLDPITSAIDHMKPSNLITNGRNKSTKIAPKKCNIFDGRWVYKAEASHLGPFMCPFIKQKMQCQVNGRPDSEYLKWRWEARDCHIPMFNGTDMLERMRNKRMILVGDSLNHNMWESLVCLLYTSMSSSTTTKVDGPKGYRWKAKEYNFTLEFYWSPFLVEMSAEKVLELDKLPDSTQKWIGADIMIFNSGHWWSPRGKIRGLEFFEYQGEKRRRMPIQRAYERSLKTWATWVERNVDPNKTTVYYRSYSPVHKNGKHGQWCPTKTQPIMDESYVPDFPRSMFDVVENVLKGMNNTVKVLNVTKLSNYRIDAHPSKYTGEYEINNYADCSHWCIPGVPDTWNRLLYASLFFDLLPNTPNFL